MPRPGVLLHSSAVAAAGAHSFTARMLFSRSRAPLCRLNEQRAVSGGGNTPTPPRARKRTVDFSNSHPRDCIKEAGIAHAQLFLRSFFLLSEMMKVPTAAFQDWSSSTKFCRM
ncbi:hypothetical protein EVAR_21030_1 [Eumeta japonica]|uniref:Uncharacterized protein n=1 Tax=Eumeta variegata TaxID=151549 RepID=A0A4C1V150_EUMVA|nr:hypothetical protein EVAR_21030_1 [Eumeta japonica]